MDAISKPLISEHLQRKNQLKCFYRISVTSDYLSTFKGKTLIVKNFLLAQMGFETEIRGIPEKYKKEVNDLIWKFLPLFYISLVSPLFQFQIPFELTENF
jgi:hypothetical protein